MAEKGRSEATGAEDALWFVLLEIEGLKGVAVQLDGAAQGRQGRSPIAAFQGCAIDVVMRLGLRDGVGDDAGHLLEVVLAGLQVANDDFQLRKAVEQGRQAALLLGRQIAEPLDEVEDLLALAVAPQRQSVAGSDGARVQIVPAFKIHHGFVQVQASLAIFVLLRLNIEHGNLQKDLLFLLHLN